MKVETEISTPMLILSVFTMFCAWLWACYMLYQEFAYYKQIASWGIAPTFEFAFPELLLIAVLSVAVIAPIITVIELALMYFEPTERSKQTRPGL